MAIGIRDWAKKKGINPNEIKYDPTTKKVTVAGMNVGAGTPTYGTKYVPQQLSDMTRNYVPQKVQTGSMYNEEKLNNQYDLSQIDAASRAREQARMNYERTLGQGLSNFKYEPNKDVAYQSAMNQADMNIRSAQNRLLGDMQRRGILNSSITTDRANQIAADEMARVQTQVAPQLEQQAYNRWLQSNQDKLNRALAQYNMADSTYKDRFGAYDTAKRQREAQAAQQAKLLNDKAISDAELKAKQNAATLEFERSLKLKDRQAEIDTNLTKLRNSQKVASGSSVSNGNPVKNGSTSPAKGEAPAFTKLTEAEKRLEDGFIAKKQGYDPATGTVTTVSGKRVVDKKDIPKFMQAVNSMGVTAKDKIALYNTFGLQKQANQIYLSPDYQMAVKNPDSLISTLAKRYSNNSNEFERMVGYYGLWNYYISRLND